MKRVSLGTLSRNKVFIIAMLIFFSPFGVYLMWKHTAWKKITKIVISLIVALIFIFATVIGYNAPPSIQVAGLSSTGSVQVSSDSYLIRGTVSTLHPPSVTINNETVAVDKNGEFTKDVELRVGNNPFTIAAKSIKGETRHSITIHRAQTSEKASQEDDLSSKDFYKVTSITDGDTIKIRINGETKTVRFIGLDTPETKDPRKPVQCYGKEASSRMQHYVQGKNIRLEKDPSQGDTDRYGRLLRYVFLEDNTHVGLQMIKEGYAREYTYNKPYAYQSEFKKAQDTAKINNIGLWSLTTCAGTTEAVNAESSSIDTQTTQAPPVPVTTPPQQSDTPGSTYYVNCKAARAAGAAPVSIGQPGYGAHLDGDGDGIACE